MAKYTTQLRSICEFLNGMDGESDKGYQKVEDIIAVARPKVFNFDYPIFDEEYKSVLETKIIKHFYLREIGCETLGEWKLMLDRRMNEIMPYYNQLYKSELLEFNPFYNVERAVDKNKINNSDKVSVASNDSVDFNEMISHTSVATDETENIDVETNIDELHNGTQGHDNWTAYSDTPQGGLTGIENNQYLTNATHEWSNTPLTTRNTADDKTTVDNDRTLDRDVVSDSHAKNKNQSSAEGVNKENMSTIGQYMEYVLGKEGTETYSEMLMKYRQTFLNIDMMVIDNLRDLFMNLW